MCVFADVSAAVRGGFGAAEESVERAESLRQGAATGTAETTAGSDQVHGELLQRPGETHTHMQL